VLQESGIAHTVIVRLLCRHGAEVANGLRAIAEVLGLIDELGIDPWFACHHPIQVGDLFWQLLV